VYATCSWLPVENEQQIEQFVHNSPLQLVRTALVGNPMEDADTMWLAELTLP